jgi:hypothetical protein
MSYKLSDFAQDATAALDATARYYGWIRSVMALTVAASIVIGVVLLLPVVVTAPAFGVIAGAAVLAVVRLSRMRKRLENYADNTYNLTATLQAIERHGLGRDGLPRFHCSQRTLVARANNVDRYVVRFDYGGRVKAVGGGKVVAQYRDARQGFECAEIMLTRILQLDDTHYLELEFGFPRRPKERPPARFRLGFNRPFQSVTLHIAFDARSRPGRVWKAIWTDIEAAPKDVEQVALNPDGTANWYLKSETRGRLYGFRWEFG